MEVIDLLSDTEGDGGTKANGSSRNADDAGGNPCRSNRHDGIGVQECTMLQNAGVSVNGNDSKPSEIKNREDGRGALVTIDDEDLQQQSQKKSCTSHRRGVVKIVKNPYNKEQSHSSSMIHGMAENAGGERSIENPCVKKRKAAAEPRRQQPRKAQLKDPPGQRELQAGLVFEEDVDHIQHNLSFNQNSSILKQSSLKASTKKSSAPKNVDQNDSQLLTMPPSAQVYAQHQFTTRLSHNLPPILYHDCDFIAGNPQTVDGSAKAAKSETPKCRCRPPKPCKLAYSSKAGPNHDRPYYCCQKGKSNGCNHFSWAFTSHMLHWYRFGPHNGHVVVKPNRGFRAEDLVQGKVGDCWFLSALAVVAERDDLIGRLISAKPGENNYGVIEVKLFVDGYWKKIIIDDFLPCLIDSTSEKEEEDNIKLALMQSLEDAGIDSRHMKKTDSKNDQRRTSSKFDPHCIADDSRRTLSEIHEFLHHDRFSKDPSYRANPHSSFVGRSSDPLQRRVLTSDLAYSKARHNQLWVPFVEKAYAKIHGSYRAISGGHVEEAFLDLSGAPTAVYNFDHYDFNPRQFWSELLTFRSKRLPMGCGTSSSQGGIIGMHAYSILDVREVRNVGMDFFCDKIAQGTLGNVSGFTDLDGIVRLLRIRNPHGQGEWKGEFSDKSPVWERLMQSKNGNWKESNGAVDLTAPQSPELKRTMVNDGTFWIDYDSFIMGFSNVDVVLAFQGNHAKSFGSSFPIKKSNHRCTRAFSVGSVGRQPGEEGSYNEKVEVYVMCIQKTRRGASLGRTDRKKSYKVSDVGILVGECSNESETSQIELGKVDGCFFGLNRNGHIRLELDRSDPNKRLIVMPVSFGHPSATDEERSFVVRFVADAPLLVQELPEPPKLNVAMHKFCFGGKVMALGNAGTSQHRGTQGNKTVLMECRAKKSFLFKILRVDCLAGGGGTVLLYLIVNDESLSQMSEYLKSDAISFSIEINCRGMVCRTDTGMVNHEVISKGKKFEAAWRRFSLSFTGESKSRLLAAVVQGGQDYQMGSIKCISSSVGHDADNTVSGPMTKYTKVKKKQTTEGISKDKHRFAKYEEFGLFTSVDTPLNILNGECIDLSLAFQNPNKSYEKQTEPIDLIDSTVPSGIDQNLEAAIMASITENQSVGIKDSVTTQHSFTQDIEKAIALSLKDQ
ncbi:hypothetical protein ACHAXR_013497 [Thalassiosira sp. AJA248-18]